MKVINRIILIALGAVTLSNCEKLDQNPYNSITTKNAFESASDALYWRDGFYRTLRANFTFLEKRTDIQSDLLNATTNFENREGFFQSWSILSNNGSIASMWFDRYKALADINLSIEKFPSIPTTSASERTQVNQYLGEAYALRAYIYLQLAQRYCPQYSDANKNTPDLGLPLVTSYDIKALPARTTLVQTFDLIYSDIEQAKTLLSSKAGVQGATTFTIDAVRALEARAALTKGDYTKAYQAATAVIATGKYPLVNTATALDAIWRTDAKNESVVQLFTSANEGTPTYSLYTSLSRANGKYTPDFIPSQWVVDLYEDNDIRKNIYLKELPTAFKTGNFTTALVNKYPIGSYGSANSYVHAAKIFRVAELYLIAAEAAYKAGETTNAQNYLNLLRRARISRATDITATGEALFEEIKNERIRELAFEGFRLDDLKRWGDPVRRHDPQGGTNYITIQPAEQFYQLNKPATDFMFVWPIPLNDTDINKNIKQNPGY